MSEECISCKEEFEPQGEEIICFACAETTDRTINSIREVKTLQNELCECGCKREEHEEGLGHCWSCNPEIQKDKCDGFKKRYKK